MQKIHAKRCTKKEYLQKKIHAKKYRQKDVQKKEKKAQSRDQRRAYFIHLCLPQKKETRKEKQTKNGSLTKN